MREDGAVTLEPSAAAGSGQVASYERMWRDLETVGRDPRTGGYRRFVWNDADLNLREWFAGEASARGFEVVEDANGNQFAWRESDAAAGTGTRGNALLLGSHLDSVPDGGAFDGPLGVVSSFAALDLLDAEDWHQSRPLVIASFADEEGARFGIACAGSRLLTGSLSPDKALALRDRDGLSMAEVLRGLGRDPERIGAQPEILARVGTFVELHVEQGRALVDADAPVGVASAIWPHGRYRFDFTGEANHAGTTLMEDRRDPMLTYAMTALAANKQARVSQTLATFGRMQIEPNGTNAVPSLVRAWLDARAGAEEQLDALVERITTQATERAERDGTTVTVTPESVSQAVHFDETLRDDLASTLGGVPILATGAGHDAGVLSQHGIPTAMLFVRNPTGVSHSPHEFAEQDDCVEGVRALAGVIRHLAGAR